MSRDLIEKTHRMQTKKRSPKTSSQANPKRENELGDAETTRPRVRGVTLVIRAAHFNLQGTVQAGVTKYSSLDRWLIQKLGRKPHTYRRLIEIARVGERH